MSICIVVGTQWGDEGKGRFVDLLSAKADIVARYSGGDNAGHTVTVGKNIFKLHLIPSGIIHPHTVGILGGGMVINPTTLLSEMELLQSAGIQITPARLVISLTAHLVTPVHKILDKVQEEARGGDRIGTTGRGIGPAYGDKAARHGIRAEEILKPAIFKQRMMDLVKNASEYLKTMYGKEPLDIEGIVELFVKDAMKLAPFIKDISLVLRNAIDKGERILAEGAQGTLLDIDHGTYPFVTSSNTTATGALVGLGLGIQPIERVVGVVKAFQTRVGSGPFPTEVFGEAAERLRGTGENPWDEFGTTTGRPRRVGWLDGVLLRYAINLNGITELALTKLDILTGLKTLRICTAYQVAGENFSHPPQGVAASALSSYTPVFEDLPGWEKDIQPIRNWDDLPLETRQYIQKIEEIAGVPVRLMSVGPEREQVIKSK